MLLCRITSIAIVGLLWRRQQDKWIFFRKVSKNVDCLVQGVYSSYFQFFLVYCLNMQKKVKEVITEKIIRLRKEGSLLGGARVPRFPSYIYIYIFLYICKCKRGGNPYKNKSAPRVPPCKAHVRPCWLPKRCFTWDFSPVRFRTLIFTQFWHFMAPECCLPRLMKGPFGSLQGSF